MADHPSLAAKARQDELANAGQGCVSLEHDPEKWTPVFGKDHASAKKAKSGMTVRRKVVPL
jgi:hypothetical protein